MEKRKQVQLYLHNVQVGLAPGQMLLYESARLPHGRTRPLRGESYTNIFVHYRPANTSWHTTDDLWRLTI